MRIFADNFLLRDHVWFNACLWYTAYKNEKCILCFSLISTVFALYLVSQIIDESTCLGAPGDDNILQLDLVEHVEREAEVVLEALHRDAGVVAEATHAAAVGRHADSAAQVRDPVLGV